jgi:hypothetical protein
VWLVTWHTTGHKAYQALVPRGCPFAPPGTRHAGAARAPPRRAAARAGPGHRTSTRHEPPLHARAPHGAQGIDDAGPGLQSAARRAGGWCGAWVGGWAWTLRCCCMRRSAAEGASTGGACREKIRHAMRHARQVSGAAGIMGLLPAACWCRHRHAAATHPRSNTAPSAVTYTPERVCRVLSARLHYCATPHLCCSVPAANQHLYCQATLLRNTAPAAVPSGQRRARQQQPLPRRPPAPARPCSVHRPRALPHVQHMVTRHTCSTWSHATWSHATWSHATWSHATRAANEQLSNTH